MAAVTAVCAMGIANFFRFSDLSLFFGNATAAAAAALLCSVFPDEYCRLGTEPDACSCRVGVWEGLMRLVAATLYSVLY